jgi:hypothetical protein
MKVSAIITNAGGDTPVVEKVVNAMQKALQLGGVNIDIADIEATIEFVIEQSFDFPDGVPIRDDIARTAIARTFAIGADIVDVVAITLAPSRRLQVSGKPRRLARFRVNAAIRVSQVSMADVVKLKASDQAAVGARLASEYANAYNVDATGTPPITVRGTNATTPTMSMDISYVILSDDPAGLQAPSLEHLSTAFAQEGPKLAALSSRLTVETPTPTIAPTPAPTVGTSSAPTSENWTFSDSPTPPPTIETVSLDVTEAPSTEASATIMPTSAPTELNTSFWQFIGNTSNQSNRIAEVQDTACSFSRSIISMCLAIVAMIAHHIDAE